MGKKRNLNGLPNSLIERYFSTLFHWDKAYMADWIWNAATEKGFKDIEIDVLKIEVCPKEIQIKPITGQLHRLHETIVATLRANNFPTDFIIDARFKIIVRPNRAHRLLFCQGTVTDKDGRVYEGKVYTQVAYEATFTVFPV